MEIGLFSVYMLKAAIYLLLFFAFNKLFLSKDTFHALNRGVWLLSVVAAFLLPAYVVDAPLNEVISLSSSYSQGINLDAFEQIEEVSLFGLDSVVKILFYIYIVGVVLLLASKVVVYGRLVHYIFSCRGGLINSKEGQNSELLAMLERSKERLNISRGIKFIVHNGDLAPFSWLNYIVVSKKDINEGAENILLHELAHAKFFHSFDIIFLDLASIVMWFNPAIWLVKRELQQVHEYSADNVVLKSGANCKEYQLLLIKKAVGDSYYSVANSFNHSSLKKRITMMLKKRSNKWVMAKSLYALPLVMLVVNVYANPSVSNNLSDISAVVIESAADTTNKQEVIVIGAGDVKVNDVLSGDVKVVDFRGVTKDGKEPLIVVDGKEYSGNVSEIPAESISSISVLKDAAATKIYGEEKGSNGVIIITLKDEKDIVASSVKTSTDDTIKVVVNGTIRKESTDVTFDVVEAGNSTVAIAKSNNESGEVEHTSIVVGKRGISAEADPLIIVDGKEYEGDMSSISPETISSISVLKGESAIKSYGQEKGANGVIVVTLK